MKPHNLDAYKDRYDHVSFERDDAGILLVTIHDGDDPSKPLRYHAREMGWRHPHVELSHCFYDIARDYQNEIVILTGAGGSFIGQEGGGFVPNAETVGKDGPTHPDRWDWIMSDGIWLQLNLLNIEVPVIAAVAGEAVIHAELALQSDIVLASDDAIFQDLPHFEAGTYVPGDGVATYWPEILGQTRGSYFLLTGQKLNAEQALSLGVVNEVMKQERLIPRARELALEMLRRPKLVRRYARAMITHAVKQRMLGHLGHGLALEGLAAAGRHVREGSK